MARPNLTEILVSTLGKRQESFGIGELLAVAALVMAMAVYLALEYGLGRLVARLFKQMRAHARRRQEPPSS